MPEPTLTPDRIREALLLLQATAACKRQRLTLELSSPAVHVPIWGVSTHSRSMEDQSCQVYEEGDTLTEALTGLLDALGAEPWSWPSASEVRVLRAQFNADEDDVLRVLCGYFSTEPLMVLALLAKLGGRDA